MTEPEACPGCGAEPRTISSPDKTIDGVPMETHHSGCPVYLAWVHRHRKES